MIEQKNPNRATILPVSEGTFRPLWSVMIPTYNCANYLQETLMSVLAQDLGAEIMQIEVVDDGSTADDPAAVVAEIGKGRVSFYRQPENVGYIRNYETCIQRARGKWVHILHGDDCVREGFYQKMQEAFTKHPEIGAAFCRAIKMNEHSHWLEIEPLLEPESRILSNWLERIAVRQLITTVSIVVAREVYEKLGGFDRRFSSCAEDWEMWVRIAADYPVWYEIEPLAIRRRHSISLSGGAKRTGKDMQDVRKAIEMVQQYLPEEKSKKLTKMAAKNYGIHAICIAKSYLNSGNFMAALSQIREALKCSRDPKVILSSAKLMTYLGVRAMKNALSSD